VVGWMQTKAFLNMSLTSHLNDPQESHLHIRLRVTSKLRKFSSALQTVMFLVNLLHL
jgi:hypothetical protein